MAAPGFWNQLGQGLVGRPEQFNQLPRFTPQQQGLQGQTINSIQDILKMIQPGAQGGRGQFDFAPIAQQARTNFQSQTAPSIAERFAALGGSGTRGSSGINSALAGAGANLEQSLASLQSQYGLAQQGQQNQLLQTLLGFSAQPSYENIYFPGSSGLLGQSAQGIGQGVGALGGAGLDYIINLIARKLGIGG